jgi:4'-phosphopantetheinyl transferase EntD
VSEPTIEVGHLVSSLKSLLPRPVSIEAMVITADCERGLYPTESAAIENAVAKRRREFAAGRVCARNAMVRLGIQACPIPVGAMGEPVWPDGVKGSITHDGGYAIVGLAAANDIGLLGIDLARSDPLGGLTKLICTDDEIADMPRWRSSFRDCDPFKVVFSLKEAVYKCLFPIVRRIFDFHDVTVRLDSEDETAEIELGNRPMFSRLDASLNARYRVLDGYVFSIVWTDTSAAASRTKEAPLAEAELAR